MNSVVIGAGFGGIAACLRLKSKGHNVTLIEKHPDLGGRARVFKKNGFIKLITDKEALKYIVPPDTIVDAGEYSREPIYSSGEYWTR